MLIASAIAVNCGIFFAIAALHGKGDNYLVGYNLTSEEQNYTRSEDKYFQTTEGWCQAGHKPLNGRH